jgi:hypothetical protein
MATHITIQADTARRAWSRRVLRVGGLIQAGFAGFWLVRGSLAIGGIVGTLLAAALLAVSIAAIVYGVVATSGLTPRPRDAHGTLIGRQVTIASVIQLLASFVAPFAVIVLGHPDLVVPSIAVTIGPLLLWLDYRLDIPRFRVVGWALTVAPILLALAISGSALSAVVGLGAGALLFATALTGFRQLAHDVTLHGSRQQRRDAKTASLAVPAGSR